MVSCQTIFGITSWSLTCISIIIFVFIFIIYIRAIKEERESDVSLLLTINTCLAACLTSLSVLMMISSNIFNGFLLNNYNFCCAFGLFYDMFECSIYYSYCLQSFYRLIRTVYYRKRSLLSYNLYRILIIVQWVITVCLVSPTIYYKWYVMLPEEYYCLVPYVNILGSVYLLVILYSIPLFSIISIYIFITRYIRSTTMIRLRERARNLRDITVMKRIILCILMLILLRFPAIIFIIFGVFNGSLFFLTYPILGLVTATCLTFIGLITITITNKFKKQVFKIYNEIGTQIYPTTNRVTPVNNTLATIRNFN